MVYSLVDTTALYCTAHWTVPYLKGNRDDRNGPKLLQNLCTAAVCLNSPERVACVAGPHGRARSDCLVTVFLWCALEES